MKYKTITPESLALAKKYADYENLYIDRSVVSELLSDREFNEFSLMAGHEMKLKAREERDALRMKLAEHGISSDIDSDVKRYKETLANVESFTEEYTLRQCENELMQALGLNEHGGWFSLLDQVKKMIDRATTAESNYRFMVERAANQKLDGYRELAQRAAEAENARDVALQELRALKRE